MSHEPLVKLRTGARPAASWAQSGVCRAPENPVAPRLRVALVNPPDPSSSDAWARWIPPLGLGYVASVARLHGFHVDVFDYARDLSLDDRLLDRSGLFEDYQVYGLSTYSEIWHSAVNMFRRIRARAGKALIVLGGYHASTVSEEILRDYPEVDVIVCNEGEEAFAELLESCATGRGFTDIAGIVCRGPSGEIVHQRPRTNILDLDRLPYPVTELRHRSQQTWNLTLVSERRNKKTISMVSSRGCPKRCTFCSIIVLSPDYRYRSVESLMEEVRYRHEREPFSHIVFQDANFLVRVPRTVEFAQALYAYNPEITWSGTATADQVAQHAEVLFEIGRLNCAYLEIGIESGNRNSLSRFNKKTTVEHNERALALLAAAGIGIGLDFIMFEPEMTLEDLNENLRFLYRNELFGYWPCEHLFQELRLFPRTPLRTKYARMLQIEFPPHDVPVTPFFDRGVETAWRCMQYYMQRYHMPINQLMKDLVDPVNRLLFGPGGGAALPAPIIRLCQRVHGMLVHLRHQPYHFFVRLLDCHDELQAGLAAEVIAARMELRSLHQILKEARELQGELLATVRAEGLEKLASVWLHEERGAEVAP